MGAPRKDVNNEDQRRLTQLVCGTIYWRAQASNPKITFTELERIFGIGPGLDDVDGRRPTGKKFQRYCGLGAGTPENASRAAPFETLKKIAKVAISRNWLSPWEWQELRNLGSIPTQMLDEASPSDYFKERGNELKVLVRKFARVDASLSELLEQLALLKHFTVKFGGSEIDLDQHVDDEVKSESMAMLSRWSDVIQHLTPREHEFNEQIKNWQASLSGALIYFKSTNFRPTFLQPRPGPDLERVNEFLERVVQKRKRRGKQLDPGSDGVSISGPNALDMVWRNTGAKVVHKQPRIKRTERN